MRRSDLSSKAFGLLMGLILLAGLGLRLWDIHTPQLWEDDALNLDRAMMAPSRLFEVQKYQGPADTIFDFQPPLSYLLTHAALAVDDSALAARAPALAAGVLSILGLGLLGAACCGRRAGLLATALAGISLFHIEFSRAIKPYALFLCCLAFSLYFLKKATESGRARHLLGFFAASAAMLYAGYQGVPVLLAETMFAAGLFFARKDVFSGPDRGRRLLGLALAGGAAVAVWLPFLPGLVFLQKFLANPGVDPWYGLNLRYFADVLSGFVNFVYPVPPLVLALAGLLMLAGAMGCRRSGAALVVLAALIPAAAVLTSRSDLRPIASWRHLIAAYPAVVVLLGAGAVWIGDRILTILWNRPRPWAGLALAAGLCAVVAWPGLSRLDEYYRRTLSQERDFYRYLSRLPGDATALAFTGYQRNAKAFLARWHLPGRFAGPGDFAAPAYRRIYVSDNFNLPSQRLRAMPPGQLVASWRAAIFNTRLARAGLASRAPLLLAPNQAGAAEYGDAFTDWRYYADAFSSANFQVDADMGMLRPARYEAQAQAVWRFDLPAKAKARLVTATIGAALFKKNDAAPADSTLTVSASRDGKTYAPLAVIDQADFRLPDGTPRARPHRFFEEMGFYRECREAAVAVDLTPFADQGSIWLRVEYAPGTREGFLNLDGVRLTAALEPGPEPADPLAFYAANLVRNCGVAPWRPGETLLGPAAYAFAGPKHAGLAGMGQAVGTPAELADFLAAHPGLDPAYVLRDDKGEPAVLLYDPALAAPGIPLSTSAPARDVRLAPSAPQDRGDVGALWLWGTLNAPTLRLGDTEVAVPVVAPPGAVLRLTPGRDGVLSFAPNFDPPDFIDGPAAHFRNMAASTSYPEYSGGACCQPNTYCSFDYVFVSAFPVTELRIMAFPRLYGDAKGQGSCRVSWSADGRNFREILDFRNAKAERWSPLFERRFVRVKLEQPATFVTVRFSLFANAAAEFWSPTRPIDRMLVEAALDTRAMPEFRLPGPAFTASLANPEGNDLRLLPVPAAPGKERVWPGD